MGNVLQISEKTIIINSDDFSNDDTIETIIFPSTLETIDEYAFQNCKNLKEIIFENSKMPRIARRAFEGCINLKNIYISGDTLPIVHKDAFNKCDIENLYLNTKAVDYEGFEVSSKCINLGKDVVKINLSKNYTSSITVDKDNKIFSSKDGLLYSSDGSTLYCCPKHIENKNIILPKECKIINTKAFSGVALDSLTADNLELVRTNSFVNSLIKKAEFFGNTFFESESFYMGNFNEITIIGNPKFSTLFIAESPFFPINEILRISHETYNKNKALIDALIKKECTEKLDLVDPFQYLLNNKKECTFKDINNFFKESER